MLNMMNSEEQIFSYYSTRVAKDEINFLLFVEKDCNLAGYKTEFLKEELPTFLRGFVICTECKGLMRDASGIGDPQRFVCKTCAKGETTNPLPPNNSTILSLVMSCPLKQRGCDWEGNISSAEAHLDTCNYFNIECPLSCGFVLRRADMHVHQTARCPLREIKCLYCGEYFQEIESILHQGVCSNFLLECMNKCGGTIKRKDLNSHTENVCPNAILDCDYKKYGCDVRVARKDLDKHTNNDKLAHIELLMCAGIQNLTEQLERVNEKNQSMATHLEYLIEENSLQKNVLCFLTNEFGNLKQELKTLKGDIKIQTNLLENTHETFVINAFNPLVTQLNSLETSFAPITNDLKYKVNQGSFDLLNSQHNYLHYLTCFQHKRTFKLTEISKKVSRSLQENWEELKNDAITKVTINYEPVDIEDAEQMIRFTGLFSVRGHCNTRLNICIQLINYSRDQIVGLLKFSAVLEQPEDAGEQAKPLNLFHHPRKPLGTLHTHVLGEFPIEEIRKGGVCVKDTIFIQVYYYKEENDV